MKKPFYITTPIYYVNAKPHLGHAYTTIVADVVCRFNRMQNKETFLLTGTDEHGDKVVRAAERENLSPGVYSDKISRLFKELWPELNINYNSFIRTTDPSHISVVEHILKKINDSGDIYFSEYEGLYCFGCERFYTERELVDRKCPDHKTEPEVIKESNYFFRMSRYQDWLINHIRENPEFIRPERYKNEVLSFLKEPLEDLCISRPKTRLEWGISLPFDDKFVTYVWFDALLNYVSALGYPDGELFRKYWPAAQHIVAKDILKPHGIYWPIMLKAAGIPIYRHLNVHGYWNVDQSKMSKSLGNVVEPLSLKNTYGLDAFRYFLLREMVFGLDSGFNEEALVLRLNSDLANDLGNLFSRVITMAHKYFGGIVPQTDPETENELEGGLKSQALAIVEEYEKEMESFSFHKALISVWEFISLMNKYVDVTAPWVLAKKKSSRKQLEFVISNLLEGLSTVSGLIYPVMPDTAKTMQYHLGQNPDDSFYDMKRLKALNSMKAGTSLPKSISLFPRVDRKKDESSMPEKKTGVLTPEIKPEITIEQLAKIDLRVATITGAESIPGAKKILKLEVDLGESRTIVAGIASSYSPEELIGKQVILVANLKPAKIMGIISNGMLLAATDENGRTVATLDRKVKPGTPLS
ncbi:MAG: methionine--tRNA ligase [Desulfobacteraceae bacterium A6]|nr:MAG: methionine--tRNA ligase [Desulfobacteraceae bacterium A6]